ncbi:MAG: helix-hairpin-helix domain-containing protein [Bacteroidetes bacterium]|nr:helix-hairpin-helix domain-containing protein [Bacteroidota bacterium]
MMRIFLNILFLLLFFHASAQKDTLAPIAPEESLNSLEDYLQNTGSEGAFDYNTLFEALEIYRDHPLNLNEADEEDFRELGLLTDIQILDLISYRNQMGDLIALYELQSIPSFDLASIRRILPYVRVKGGLDDFQVSLPEMIKSGKNDLYIRWARILEEQKGYIEDENDQSKYAGNPNSLYLRFKHSYSNRLSIGFTAEKDKGEEFFTGSNKTGFDYYSAHFFLKDYNKTLKAVAIGDFSASMGQGLVLFTGYGSGKGAAVMNIKRTSQTLRSYSSVNETGFLRGAGVTLSPGENWEITAFASRHRRDANLLEPDTTDVQDDLQSFSSFLNAGLHRTESEIADEKALGQTTFGGVVKYKTDRWHLALNSLYTSFDKSLFRDLKPYNRFYFKGGQLANMSLDYSYIYQNFNFFGETAISDNGRMATTNGLLIGLDRRADLALLHRHYSKDYQSLFANSFAETDGARNETGFYIGLKLRPLNNWEISSYVDTYKHSWLRFGTDGPSKGIDWLVRLTYKRKRKMEAYLQLRNETKEKNASDAQPKQDFLSPSRLFQARLHLSNRVSKSLELRSRLDMGFSQETGFAKATGILLYQDIIYKSINFPLSFTTRFAVFDTDGYDIRFYAYENDLIYTFSIPAYYHKGTRFYLNLRYKGIRNMTLELRYAQTYWANQQSIGSGYEIIEGQTRSEVKAQVKYSF